MGANLSSTSLLHKAVLESELYGLEDKKSLDEKDDFLDQYRCDSSRIVVKQWLENRISKLSETENDQ